MGIQRSIFPTILRVDVISRSRARKWTSHATPCVLMDVDLKIRSFSCSCRDEILQATDPRGDLHKIPDFYFEQARTDFMESSLLGPQFGYLLRYFFKYDLKSSFIFVFVEFYISFEKLKVKGAGIF